MAYNLSQATNIEAYYDAASVPAVTGDGTIYTLVPNQVGIDTLGEYDNMTGQFVFRDTGVYLINVRLALVGIDATNTNLDLRLWTGIDIFYYIDFSTPFPVISTGGPSYNPTYTLCANLPGATALFLALTIGGVSKNVDIIGSNGTLPYATGFTIARIR